LSKMGGRLSGATGRNVGRNILILRPTASDFHSSSTIEGALDG
jgi:hypothetical protein